MMIKRFFILFAIIQMGNAEKCKYVYIESEFQTVECINVMSMMEIADEIKSNWSSVSIINKATHTQFSNFAVNVPYLNAIQTLDLSRVGKLNLSDSGFRDYDSLKNLNISNTQLQELKPNWFSKKTLEVLNLSDNELKAIKKDDLKFLTKLRIFNASFNEIKTVENLAFHEMKKIETISLTNNFFTVIAFDDLGSLRHLFLRDNLISFVWAVTFYRMPKLETLILAQNKITGIVDGSFTTLEGLKYLNLSNNLVPHISPWTFNGMEKGKLLELDLSYNLITIIYPICLSYLSHLTYLDISNNKITEIYEKNFAKAKSLIMLYLSHNKISKIAPKSFENMLTLKTFDLSSNKLETFTAEMFGGVKFTGNKLRILRLTNNKIASLKSNVFQLMLGLVTLDLSENQLTNLTEDLLKNNRILQQLFINSNKIEYFPKGFFSNLINLMELHVDNNKISFLPVLPENIRLQKISFSNNPWQCRCLQESIVWSRKRRIAIIDFTFNAPACINIPDTTCIRDFNETKPYQLFDRYTDAVNSVDMQREGRDEY